MVESKSLKKMTVKELVSRLNSLEVSLHYNEMKGHDEEVRILNDEVYMVRKEISSRVKEIMD